MESNSSTKNAAASGVDPDVARFVSAIAAEMSSHPDLYDMPVERARAICARARAPWVEGGPVMAESIDAEAPGRSGPVRVRVHRPSSEDDLPALVYMHGGGWTFFNIDTHDRLMREYAARAGIAVMGVDYALSPEAKYPRALHQVLDVTEWLAASAERFGIDGGRLALGGDSAGANLAVASSLALRDTGRPGLVRALLLNYGAFATRWSKESERRYGGKGYMLGAEEMRWFWNNYVSGPGEFSDPLVCPLLADVEALPPAFFTIPECDILTAQNHAMAEKMWGAGVQVRAREYPGATHSFLEAMSIAEISNRALDEACDWLRGVLGRLA